MKEKGICTVQKSQDGGVKWHDHGDYLCCRVSDGKLQLNNAQGVSTADRIIFDKAIYYIRAIHFDKIELRHNLTVRKDEAESGWLALMSAGIETEDGVKVAYEEGLEPEELKFFENWAPIWTRNLCNNYHKIRKARTIKDLKNAGIGKPAIIVGAGPSLDKNIGGLKDQSLRKNAVIIATDRAYKALLANGIEPEFVVSVDCHDGHITEYLKAPSFGHKLVLNTCADHHVHDVWQGEIFYYNMYHKDMHFTDKVLPELFPDMPVIENLGCVTNTAIMFSDWLGCKVSILVGNDFGYTDNKICCKQYDWDGYKFVEKVVDHAAYLEWRTAKIVSGGVTTYVPYITYARTLEYLCFNKKLQIVNATEGGIIKRIPRLTLEEAKEKYCSLKI